MVVEIGTMSATTSLLKLQGTFTLSRRYSLYVAGRNRTCDLQASVLPLNYSEPFGLKHIQRISSYEQGFHLSNEVHSIPLLPHSYELRMQAFYRVGC